MQEGEREKRDRKKGREKNRPIVGKDTVRCFNLTQIFTREPE